MAPTIPTAEPRIIIAGDSAIWTRTFADYPTSEGWALTYSFRGPTACDDVDATIVDSEYSIEIAATTTAKLAAGAYDWIARVSLDGEVHTAARGTTTIVADPAKIGARTSHNATVLAALEAAIEGRVTADVESYSIGGRSISKIPMRDLMTFRGIYARRVWKENNPTLANPSVVAVMSRAR